ncbi:type II toxin-antitoxin system RelE/ParE family toxin [Salipaludibacillus sp. CUR1]|uniref:type II toxin-antitoxin system RelE/ParE family toxin n=1 Tax=Salipaludibacillus sp. CUR1 TaxID=2820003 RepID=UPI001E419611|nr:type II toxin-antitoxin system RelE/ParE family toxin [Salipaludibacillus sp. CUR1]MCE7792840.1 type II toxin-antitoxin system RelE/ParE family toxin [Salipaludibacillus sp. CUR1]
MEKNNFKVKMTAIAEEDLEHIYNYLTHELYNQSAAIKLMNKIEKNIIRLKHLPFSCPLPEDEFLRKKGYRKLIIDNYIAFYLIDDLEQEVIIMRVLYGKQKFQRLL